MTNKPATFKQRDMERALKAMAATGYAWAKVRVTREGDIVIENVPTEDVYATPEKPVAARGDIKL